MVSVSYRAKVPGSLMLFGEHAVLHHKQAVVVAINRYIKINLIPRSDRQIKIVSSVFGVYITTLDNLKIIEPYIYILTVIKQYIAKIKQGFTLSINSGFSSTIGFGSSAAVTVATIGVLNRWLQCGRSNKSSDLMQLYRQAVSVVRLVQGFGSGADVAASVFGGGVAYKMRPVVIEKLNNVFPLVAVYSGNKVTTSKAVAQVERLRKQFPDVFIHLYNAMDYCAKNAIVAIKNNQLSRLGVLMNVHQGLHDAIGVNNPVLSQIVFSLREQSNIYGAKISGSGLGDCVIGLGKIAKNSFIKNRINVAISPSGITYDT